MAPEAPVVVVGAGLSGAATAWALARRSVPVTVVEQYPPGHAHGGSHGSARIVRRAYTDPFYAALTGRAFELWDDVERQSGASLIRLLGGLDLGAGRGVRELAATLAAAGAAPEVLTPDAAESRWPGMRFDGDVVFHPQAGVLDAGAAVTALLDLARAAGAQVRHGVAVAWLEPGAVHLADGSTLPARCVVVAAGGWASTLLGALPGLPALRVTRQSVFHFPRRDPHATPWPSTIHVQDDGAVYHLSGGRDGGPDEDRKIGVHDPGPLVRAGEPGGVDPATRERIVAYVRRWLPGLVPEPRGETTCLYTSTPTEDFLLDRVDDVIVCSPCSGHGAKFAPLVGEWVAGLALGERGRGAPAGSSSSGSSSSSGRIVEPVPDRFRLAAHASARPGAVVSL